MDTKQSTLIPLIYILICRKSFTIDRYAEFQKKKRNKSDEEQFSCFIRLLHRKVKKICEER